MKMKFSTVGIIPRRIYLDTGTFQAIHDCGGFVFGEDVMPEVEDFLPNSCPQILRRTDGNNTLQYLKWIFMFDERAMFDWIISPASLHEIDAGRCGARSQYARDIMDHSSICISENPPSAAAPKMAEIMADPQFASISASDRKLLIEAVGSECDVFLTIEKKLPKSAGQVLKKVPLLIATPKELWELLEPYLKCL